MNYIINPWFFYWINVANGMMTVSIVGLFVSGITFIAGCIMVIDNINYGSDDKDYKNGKKLLKISIPMLIVFVLFVIFIPDKSTLIEMQVSKMATYENAKLAVDSLKEFVDYIVEAAKSLK